MNIQQISREEFTVCLIAVAVLTLVLLVQLI